MFYQTNHYFIIMNALICPKKGTNLSVVMEITAYKQNFTMHFYVEEGEKYQPNCKIELWILVSDLQL
jgi:hypothetical protein